MSKKEKIKQLGRKTVALTYLTTILFSLFFPFNQSFAQENFLIISTDKSDPQTGKVNLKIGELAKVTVTNNSSNLVGGETVYFSSIGNEGGLNPKTCVLPLPPSVPSCFVNYNSLIEGTFTLKANATLNGTVYESSIPITIKDCLDPKQILIKGICTTPTNIPPEEPPVKTDTTYTPLAPLPGFPEEFDTLPSKTNQCPFGNYLNIMIKLVIGIAAVLAMVMIVMGGIEYMTSDLISSKEAGKDTIKNALLGLFIALGAYLILNTINPKLLSACLDNLPVATITITPEQELTIKNRSGGGTCESITDSSKAGYPSTIEKSGFNKDTSANEPFKKLSAQASAISRLESGGQSNKLSSMDICSDDKSFSIGLFQINAVAHRNEISACKDAFTIPAGDGTSQGNPVEYVTNKNGVKYVSKWSCKTVEPAYTTCKNYLLNPLNNIKFAEGNTLYGKNKWVQWSTYSSCSNKF